MQKEINKALMSDVDVDIKRQIHKVRIIHIVQLRTLGTLARRVRNKCASPAEALSNQPWPSSGATPSVKPLHKCARRTCASALDKWGNRKKVCKLKRLAADCKAALPTRKMRVRTEHFSEKSMISS